MLESLHMAYWDTKQQDKLPTLIARASWIFDQFEKCKKYYKYKGKKNQLELPGSQNRTASLEPQQTMEGL